MSQRKPFVFSLCPLRWKKYENKFVLLLIKISWYYTIYFTSSKGRSQTLQKSLHEPFFHRLLSPLSEVQQASSLKVKTHIKLHTFLHLSRNSAQSSALKYPNCTALKVYNGMPPILANFPFSWDKLLCNPCYLLRFAFGMPLLSYRNREASVP